MTRNPRAGITLTDVIMGTAITSLVVAGTMKAFITAARLTRTEFGPMYAEAATHAQDFLEGIRNHIATDDTFFSSRGGPPAPPLPAWPAGWSNDDSSTDPLDADPTNDPFKRRYFVLAWDCDQDGVAGDCYRVTVRVCWNAPAASCPP